MKSIFAILSFFLLLQLGQNLYSQQKYVMFLDDYALDKICIPHDSIKFAETISIKSITGSDTITMSIDSVDSFITGAPRSGKILNNGILDSITRSFIKQSKGKTMTFEFYFFDSLLRKQTETVISFQVC